MILLDLNGQKSYMFKPNQMKEVDVEFSSLWIDSEYGEISSASI